MKYEKEFPLAKTKVKGVDKKFDLSSVSGRAEYFEAKAGDEIAKLKKYFADGNTFIAYLVAKKSAGKGTYTKLMKEIFGDVIGHVSAGDTVRHTYKVFKENLPEKKEIMEYLEDRYRGYMSLDDAIDALLGKSQEKLLPTEFILTLIEREIDKMPRKTLFIDGLPRDLDQISYSLYFRNLINYRKDPDFFVAIDIPESVIDERMKGRVICPICQTPRNTSTFPSEEVEYDEKEGKFYLLCDEHKERMIGKEGDDAGIESIRERTDRDQNLIDNLFKVHGLPLIMLRNGVPVDKADEYVDDYEITPGYSYELDENGKAVIKETPWIVKDDEGVDVYSLLAPPVAVSLIKNLARELKL